MLKYKKRSEASITLCLSNMPSTDGHIRNARAMKIPRLGGKTYGGSDLAKILLDLARFGSILALNQLCAAKWLYGGSVLALNRPYAV